MALEHLKMEQIVEDNDEAKMGALSAIFLLFMEEITFKSH
jgi:hypothetical protein